jgi:proline dehydrogenase
MATVQANLRRSTADVEALARAGIPVRLVKGAYAESPAVAHAWGEETAAAFVTLARRLRALGAAHALATHDPAVLRELAAPGSAVDVEHLLGVRGEQARALARQGHRVRIYVPFGPRWLRYYARRVAESVGA